MSQDEFLSKLITRLAVKLISGLPKAARVMQHYLEPILASHLSQANESGRLAKANVSSLVYDTQQRR